MNRKDIGKNTQNYHLIAVRMFLKFLQGQKKIKSVSPSSIELAKISMREIDVIGLDELNRIFDSIKEMIYWH